MILWCIHLFIPQEVSSKIKDKYITPNIITTRIQDNEYKIIRIQGNEPIMCGFYCIVFIEYMLSGKTLLYYTNFFSPNDYKKNDKIT